MEQNFKRLADGVHLPEDSRARIRAQITSHAEEQEGFKMQKSKTRLPRLAVALIVIAALTLTAAAAAVIVRQFRNTVLVSDLSEIPAPEGDTPVAVAVSEPISEAPHTLEEILAMDDRISREAWENGEQIGGTTSSLYGGWDASECITRRGRGGEDAVYGGRPRHAAAGADGEDTVRSDVAVGAL